MEEKNRSVTQRRQSIEHDRNNDASNKKNSAANPFGAVQLRRTNSPIKGSSSKLSSSSFLSSPSKGSTMKSNSNDTSSSSSLSRVNLKSAPFSTTNNKFSTTATASNAVKQSSSPRKSEPATNVISPPYKSNMVSGAKTSSSLSPLKSTVATTTAKKASSFPKKQGSNGNENIDSNTTSTTYKKPFTGCSSTIKNGGNVHSSLADRKSCSPLKFQRSVSPTKGSKNIDTFQGFAPSTKVETYSAEKLSKTGKKHATNSNGTSFLDEAGDAKTLVNDYTSLWMKGITAKAKSTVIADQCLVFAKRIQDADGVQQLRRLSIRDNDLVSTLTRAIGNDPSITSINIVNDERFSNLCPSLVVGFAEGLRTNIHITSITMIGLELGNDFLSAVADSIVTNFTIVSIDLHNNSFTNDALVDFCLGIETNTSITSVKLQTQQSPIFTLREDLAVEAITKNKYLQDFKIEFQTQSCNTAIDDIIRRNVQAGNCSSSDIDYGTKLLRFLENEAQLAEKRFQQRKKAAVAKEINDSDMPYLYELSELAKQYKLPYETNDSIATSASTSSFLPKPSSSNGTAKQSLANLHKNLLTADGAFLTDEFISQYLKEDDDDQSLTFEFTNESKIFKRFSITDPARSLIVTKFVATLVDHPQAHRITHLHMANTMTGNDFLIALRQRCVDGNGTILPKLHLVNFETNYITGPGVSALAHCIVHLRYLQAVKLDNQKQLISSEAEADLADALCVSRSVIKVSLRVRTLFERRNVNNYVVRNIDFLRQARRWYGLKTGTIKERERNKIEKLFDQIAHNDSSITEVMLVSDQVFVSLSPDEVLKVADSFKNNTYVTTVKLSGLRLDDAFAFALCKSLESNKTIEKLDIESNCIGSEGLLAIVGSLKINRTISELLVRHQSKPMASVDEEKVRGLIEGNDVITKLSIDLRSTGARDSVDKLVRINQEMKRKQSPKKDASDCKSSNMPVKRNRVQQLFDKIAANDSSVTEVDLVSDQVFVCLNEIEIEKAAKSFANNTHVTKIKMSGLKLDDKFGLLLAQSLLVNTSIIKLDLERNSIGTDGISAILSSLQTNKTIEEIFVRYQSKPISSPDEEKIPGYIEGNSKLVKLSIDIRSVGARSAADKKVRINQELRRKNSR